MLLMKVGMWSAASGMEKHPIIHVFFTVNRDFINPNTNVFTQYVGVNMFWLKHYLERFKNVNVRKQMCLI